MINRYLKWSQKKYSLKQRLLALIPAGLLFVIFLPGGLIILSGYLDRWLDLPPLDMGDFNTLLAMLLIAGGFGLALWSIQSQLSIGHGTPLPMMATQKLIITKPFNYCRNPMALGTILGYLGIAIWAESLAAVGLILLVSAILLAYIKKYEEEEMAMRFGAEYTAYKKSTPFLIPRFG